MKQKIAYFVHCFPPAIGGLEFLSGEIVKILREAGHDVQVITGQGQTLDSYKTFNNWVDTKNDPQYIHRLPLNYFWQRLANKFLNKLIFISGSFSPWYFGPILKYNDKVLKIIKNADLIVGAGMPTKMFYDAYRMAKKFNKKLISLPTYHDVNYYNKSYPFKKVLKSANKIFLLSDYEKTMIQQNYKIENNKIALITYSPYTKKSLKNCKQMIDVRLNKIKNNILTIGYIGQITNRKNLKLIADLSFQLTNLNFKHNILLAGIRTNSSEEVEKKFQKSKKVEIIYNFPEENKQDLYKDIDILINPSAEESFGITTIEAMRYACLVFSKFSFLNMDNIPFIFNSVEDVLNIITSLNNNKWKNQLNLQVSVIINNSKENFKKNLISNINNTASII